MIGGICMALPIRSEDNGAVRLPAQANREARLHQLARELNRRALQKGLTQADICRATKLGRDSMSRYFRGMTLPDLLHLTALAQTLGCTPRDLDPAAGSALILPQAANGGPAFEIKQDAANPHNVFLRINQSVPFGLAAQIMALLDVKPE